ncbi:MAG: hypothetical protein M3014_09060 [Chloroflexota bacterium]|nr:hypothetical protein [Chloroflexota bacterium]
MSDVTNREAGASGRKRPTRRVAQSDEAATPGVLTDDFLGVAAAYGNTLLFVGYEVDGKIEIVVYPRYRFSSDDRVQGYLGYMWVEPGTGWDVILAEADRIYETAQSNYRAAATLRAAELRAHGSRFEVAYDHIAEIFRESWHGFSLRLEREQPVVKGDTTFLGHAPGPILATWRSNEYTVVVFPTGSILMLYGDRRESFSRLASGKEE